MKTGFFGLLAVLVLGTALRATAQEGPGRAADNPTLRDLPHVDQLDAAAAKGADYYRGMAGRAKMGVSSAEASRAVLGQPLRSYFVRLDGLRAYQPGQDPKTLLSAIHNRVLYPMQVGDQAAGSVEMVQRGGQWKVASVGGTAIQGLEAFRREQAQKLGLGPGELFLVRVPALNQEFLGYYDPQSKMMLIPLRGSAQWGLVKGAALPADQVFLKLVPAALQQKDRSLS